MFDLFIHFRVAASHESSLSDIQIFGGKLSSLRLQTDLKFRSKRQSTLDKYTGQIFRELACLRRPDRKLKAHLYKYLKNGVSESFVRMIKRANLQLYRASYLQNLTIHLFIVRRLRNVSVSIKGSELCTRRGVKEFY